MSTRFRRALTAVASALVSTVVIASLAAPASAAATVPTAAPSASAAACAATWSATTAYSGGQTASHHGRNWTARWWTQRETPGSTSVWVDAGRCTGGGDDFVVSREEFDAIFPNRHPFYTYDGFVDALGAYPAFASTGTPETRTREVAAFLTHADFESVGLRYVKEINEANYWIKCDDEQPFGCPAGQTAYYGRGPIMFSWNFNYKAAGDARHRPAERPVAGRGGPVRRVADGALVLEHAERPRGDDVAPGDGLGLRVRPDDQLAQRCARVRRRQPGFRAVPGGPVRAHHRGPGRRPGLGSVLLTGSSRER